MSKGNVKNQTEPQTHKNVVATRSILKIKSHLNKCAFQFPVLVPLNIRKLDISQVFYLIYTT